MDKKPELKAIQEIGDQNFILVKETIWTKFVLLNLWKYSPDTQKGKAFQFFSDAVRRIATITGFNLFKSPAELLILSF